MGGLQKSVLRVLFDAVGHAVCQDLDAVGGGVEEILRDHAVDILGHGGEEIVKEDPQRLQSGHGGGVVGADTIQIVTPHLGGLNCGLLEDYANTDLPAQRKWGKDLLKKLKQTPDVWLESNTGSVELISYEDPVNEEKVIVLINHGGRTSSKRYLFVAEHISDPQPAYAVELMIKTDDKVTVKDGSKDLQFKKAGKNICVPITMDTMWKFITVKKKNRKQ